MNFSNLYKCQYSLAFQKVSSSIMVKVEMAKEFQLQLWLFFAIVTFDNRKKMKITIEYSSKTFPKSNGKSFSHRYANGFFCHFKLCHNRWNTLRTTKHMKGLMIFSFQPRNSTTSRTVRRSRSMTVHLYCLMT